MITSWFELLEQLKQIEKQGLLSKGAPIRMTIAPLISVPISGVQIVTDDDAFGPHLVIIPKD